MAKPRTPQAAKARKSIEAQRAKAFEIVDELHRQRYSAVLVEDFKMDSSQWARVLLPLRGGRSELEHEDFEILFDIAKHHNAKLAIREGYVVIWPLNDGD